MALFAEYRRSILTEMLDAILVFSQAAIKFHKTINFHKAINFHKTIFGGTGAAQLV